MAWGSHAPGIVGSSHLPKIDSTTGKSSSATAPRRSSADYSIFMKGKEFLRDAHSHHQNAYCGICG